MHATRTPLSTWFWAAYLVATLGQAAAAPARAVALGDRVADPAEAQAGDGRPERELLKREVEIDEFFLGGCEAGAHRRAPARKEGARRSPDRGPRSWLRFACACSCSLTPRGTTLRNFAKPTTEQGAIVHTGGLPSYRVLSKHGYDHRRRPQTSAAPGEQLLPRAHRAISNLKAWMHGTHRGVSDGHLPVYLGG